MLVAVASLIISAAAGLGAGFAVGWIANRLAQRRIGQFSAIAVGFLVAGALLVPTMAWMTDAVACTFIGMNPRDGERRLEFLGLPANTTNDFCYRISPVGITVLADFDMSESDFLAWMSSQNWNVVAFDLTSGGSMIHVPDQDVSFDAVVYPVRQYKTRTPRAVTRGYCYFTAKPDNPDNTHRVIYDVDSGRVYVQCTTY